MKFIRIRSIRGEYLIGYKIIYLIVHVMFSLLSQPKKFFINEVSTLFANIDSVSYSFTISALYSRNLV